MATSSNPKIQTLIDEVESLDVSDDSLEAKLQLIAQKISEEQQRMKAAIQGVTGGSKLQTVDVDADPADAFACEGCQ